MLQIGWLFAWSFKLRTLQQSWLAQQRREADASRSRVTLRLAFYWRNGVSEMPTLWKQIVFSFASILSIGSVVLLVVALSTERWVTGTTLCQTGVDLVNASSPELEQFTGHIYYGLFQGGKTRRCGLGIRRSKIYSKSTNALIDLRYIPF